MTPPRASAEGELLRQAVRSLMGHVGDTPRSVTRHLLGMARDFDDRLTPTPRPAMTGRWVRRMQGNAGPGVPGVGHVAAEMSRGLADAVAVCGTRLRGSLDWGTPARRGNQADGWHPCRSCVSAITATATITAALGRSA